MKHQPLYFGSLDARTIQYKYAIYKLERLIRAMSELLSQIESSKDETPSLVLVQYIVHLSNSLFAINDSKFAPRLSALERFEPVKTPTVAIAPIVTHIPYDSRDSEVTPLSELPSAEASVKALIALRTSAENCLEGYQKRLLNAEREIGNENFCIDLDNLIASMFNPAVDIDVSLQSSKSSIPAFLFPIYKEYSESPDGMEASLIDIDLHALFVLTESVQQSVKYHKSSLNKFKELKAAPKQKQEELLNAMPKSGYALHRILVWALRLNDLYTILRRYGRQIYFSNYHHLHDSKFLSHMANSNAFKSQVLKNIDDLFNTAKRNGVLVATITRFIRLSTRVEITVKQVVEFFGFIGQSFVLVDNIAKALEQLGKEWLACEINFRTAYNLPKQLLMKISDQQESEKIEALKKANQRKLKEVAALKEKNKIKALNNQKATERMKSLAQPQSDSSSLRSLSPLPAVPKKEEGTVLTQEPDAPITKPVLAPIDTEVAAEPTKPILPAVLTEPPEKLVRTRSSSLTNDLAIGTRPRNGSVGSRPNSQLFSSPSGSGRSSPSRPAVETVDKCAAVNTTPTGRRRSNSQPIAFNSAAAAAALGQSRDKKNEISRSPTGSIRRNGSITRTNNTPSVTSPLSSKTITLTTLEEDSAEATTSAPKLTASQKFALHLKKATESGHMYSQQRETLSSVVFDPNNPSATKFKRPSATDAKGESGSPSSPVAPGLPAVPAKQEPAREVPKGPQTRAQLTKSNTQKNSFVQDIIDVKPRLSADSTSSTPNTVLSNTPTRDSNSSNEGMLIKKVRFTGVPEYSPEEDAPTRHTRGLLKNFAIFKQPLLTGRSAYSYKSKDGLLKKEESMLFRQQQHIPR